MLDKLSNSSFDKDIRDALFDRIQRRVILVENQINPDTLNNLPKKAEGMDFLGKLKLIEEAKANQQRVEIVINDKEKVLGYVLDLWKTIQGAQIVEISLEKPNAGCRILDISKIQTLRIIMDSIFS